MFRQLAHAESSSSHDRQAIVNLHALGIRTVLLTGDNRPVAEAIARHLGIADFEAKGLKFHRLTYQWWLDNPGIDQSAAKLGKTLKEAIGG